jgi:hypothetical protein
VVVVVSSFDHTLEGVSEELFSTMNIEFIFVGGVILADGDGGLGAILGRSEKSVEEGEVIDHDLFSK